VQRIVMQEVPNRGKRGSRRHGACRARQAMLAVTQSRCSAMQRWRLGVFFAERRATQLGSSIARTASAGHSGRAHRNRQAMPADRSGRQDRCTRRPA
jgi:hypothetical protein